jgi:hypothetical protein
MLAPFPRRSHLADSLARHGRLEKRRLRPGQRLAAVRRSGDANIDGVFNSGDLVHVFQVGECEDAVAGNSPWSDGDWTSRFPARRRNYAGVYNAGLDGDPDRALVTDYSLDEGGELDFRALVQDAPLQALRLGFDLEAWQLFLPPGAGPGEAAFRVILEADTGSGFSRVADLGNVTTEATLNRPAAGNLVNGNDPAYRLSYDSGPRDVDVPQGATLRVRWMSTAASQQTVVFGLDNVFLRFAAPGDANIDGVFNSGDLVHVFQVGEYEDTIAGNSTWSDGDWTNDNDFNSSDLVAAFQDGKYMAAASPTQSVPEPGAALWLPLAFLIAFRYRCMHGEAACISSRNQANTVGRHERIA